MPSAASASIRCAVGFLHVDLARGDADRGHERREHAGARTFELVDCAGEMRQVRALAAHHLDHRGARALHQLGAACHRDRIEEDAEIHRAVLGRRHHPALELVDELLDRP